MGALGKLGAKQTDQRPFDKGSSSTSLQPKFVVPLKSVQALCPFLWLHKHIFRHISQIIWRRHAPLYQYLIQYVRQR